MPVRTFLLVVAYDGTGFHGWQRQPELRTVQGVLEESVQRVLGEGIEVAGAGRTDAGVHARGQGASLAAATRLPARALPPLLNRALPADVRVVSAEERAEGFHARHSARGRRYAYRLLDRDDLLLARHAWRPRQSIVPERLESATRVIEGTHDCASFESSGSPASTTVCRISRARWSRWEGGLLLDIVADHFLYHMVRSVVGTALAAAAARDPAAHMSAVLAARDRRRAATTAPAQALCLEQVFYPAAGEPA
jgi:tRNA pseudouridine38-40 synthase